MAVGGWFLYDSLFDVEYPVVFIFGKNVYEMSEISWYDSMVLWLVARCLHIWWRVMVTGF
jgi:hypothetical protein